MAVENIKMITEIEIVSEINDDENVDNSLTPALCIFSAF